MEKAFELKGLTAELKDKGLPLAEEAAKVAVEAVFAWVEKSVLLTENKYDDFFIMVKQVALPKLLEQVEKIDGK